MLQNIVVLTTSRSEYYQIRTVLRSLQKSDTVSLKLFVSGTHLSAQFGKTERDIVNDGFDIYERLPILVDDDSKVSSALSTGLAVQTIAVALKRSEADMLILFGDRYETLAAALAASCMGVPIAHVHGGERTDGALDDVCRHAITKLGSLHFVSTDVYRARVIQMGELPEHVFTIGAPLLDELMKTELLTKRELSDLLELDLIRPIALVAYHPVTSITSDDALICWFILECIADHCGSIVMTAPNQDPGREVIMGAMTTFINANENVKLFTNLGSKTFLSVMSCADIMIGNSSSGIHEAASFRLPVVNVGSRQSNRLSPRNVIDCEANRTSIQDAVSRALSSEFRRSLDDLKNPYGDGHAGERLVETLHQFVPFKETLLPKLFFDGSDVKAAITEWKKKHG